MKSPNNWFSALVMCVIGVILIVMHNRVDVLSTIIVILGIALILPAIFSICKLGFRRKDEVERPVSVSVVVSSLAACALGIWMVFQPTFFAGFFTYFFAILLVVYGLFRIIMLLMLNRYFYTSFWLYVIPLLIMVAGIVILCTDIRTINEIVVLIMGISLVASAVNYVIESIATKPRINREDKQLPENASSDTL